MTNYKGRDFLLKIGSWSGGTAVADCRTHSMKLNNEQVDVTNKSSNGYRTLLADAGTKSISLTMGGVMTNDAAFETLQGYAFANSANSYALGWGDGDTLEGSFVVTDYEVGGEYNAEQTFTATLQSSGAWTFTPA